MLKATPHGLASSQEACMRSGDKRPPETLKEKQFVKEYLATGNATEAAARVYDVSSRDSANAIGSQNLAKLSFEDILEKHGVSDDKLAEVLQEGLAATRTISAVAGNEANGGTVDFVDVPDFQVRHRFLETGLKLKDKFPSTKTDITSGGKPIPILGGISAEQNND